MPLRRAVPLLAFITLVLVLAGGCIGIVGDFPLGAVSADGGADSTPPPPDGAPANPDAPNGTDGGGDAGEGGGGPAARLSAGSMTLDFGTLTVGQAVAPGTIDITNAGNLSTAALHTAITGSAFSIVSDTCASAALAAGLACHVQIALNDSTAGTPQGTFTVTDTATDAVTVTLKAAVLVPGALSVSPQTFDFMSWAVGATSTSQIFTVTNTGMSASGTLTAAINPTNGTTAPEFPMTDGCSGKVLQPQGTCAISIALLPAGGAAKSASLVVTASPGGTTAASLVGRGLAPTALMVSPTSFPFATTVVGASPPTHEFTVTNTGDVASAALTTGITPGAGTAAGDFAIMTDGCKGIALAGMMSCVVKVAFSPTSHGDKAATLEIDGGQASAGLTGTGQDTVSLTVLKSGTGGGTVSDSSGTINCGSTCTASYTRASTDPMVVLSANPDASSNFTSWSGGGCSGAGTCTVALSAATTVTAKFDPLPETLNVSFNAIGAGVSASITSTPAGITCSGAMCTTAASFPLGSTVKLTVTGVPAAALSVWSPSSCSGNTCTVTMSGNQTVSYTATGNNIVFVTTAATAGNVGGVAGGNAKCQAAATSAGLPGHYVAWLATSTTKATAALGSARGWIRPDGNPFADTIGVKGSGNVGLANGQIFYPADLDQKGVQVSQATWTGAGPDGSEYIANYTCKDWTSSASADLGDLGQSNTASFSWTAGHGGSCDTLASLYCFGTDLTTPLTIVPKVGRHAFYTKGSFDPSTGISAADTLCKTEASAAGLASSGNFVALLAPNGATAASRVNASGTNWVRPDGFPLATSTANALAGNFLVAPCQHADGSYENQSSELAWTGAFGTSTAGTLASTCNNWSSIANGVTGTAGEPDSADSSAYGIVIGIQCTTGRPVYCLEN